MEHEAESENKNRIIDGSVHITTLCSQRKHICIFKLCHNDRFFHIVSTHKISPRIFDRAYKHSK